jgi:ATP-dependent RNA helicase RhlB
VERIAVSEDQVTAENVEQLVYHVGQHEKLPALLGLLAREQPPRGLIFVNTRSMASRLGEYLEAEGYSAGALAGDIDQKKRLRLLEAFKNGEIRLLVATDVASRGLHIDGVTHVFNYDLPQDPEDYVHRIGRTARAGASGKGFSLACEQYVYSLEAIEQFIGHSLPYEFPDETLLVKPRTVMRRSRARESQRGSRKDGGRSRSRSDKQAAAPRAETPPQHGETAAEPERKKKRRRRRKKRPDAVKPVAGD